MRARQDAVRRVIHAIPAPEIYTTEMLVGWKECLFYTFPRLGEYIS